MIENFLKNGIRPGQTLKKAHFGRLLVHILN